MIISRTPFRISFAGGSTDIPSFYRKYGGSVVSTSIDKYIYLTLKQTFDKQTIIRYSETEREKNVKDIKHPIVREFLKKYGLQGVELTSMADIPAGTGMGSSSTLAVGISNIMRYYCGYGTSPEVLAEDACNIEIDVLKKPIGKQDQYGASFGGLKYIQFNKDDTVCVEPIQLSQDEKDELSGNLLLFYLGGKRDASDILSTYSSKTSTDCLKMRLSDYAKELRDELNAGNLDSMGTILDKGWQIKRQLSTKISNDTIDDIYERGIGSGAIGGKLLGAGGNGFMLFYAKKDSHEDLRSEFKELKELSFKFDYTGSQIVYDSSGKPSVDRI